MRGTAESRGEERRVACATRKRKIALGLLKKMLLTQRGANAVTHVKGETTADRDGGARKSRPGSKRYRSVAGSHEDSGAEKGKQRKSKGAFVGRGPDLISRRTFTDPWISRSFEKRKASPSDQLRLKTLDSYVGNTESPLPGVC